MFEESLCGEEVKSLAGLLGAAGKSLKLWFLHMNKYLRMATVHQMKRWGLWEGFSSRPQLSQREVPSAFFISFDRMFLIETMDCVFAKNQGKARAQEEVEILRVSEWLCQCQWAKYVSLMSSCVHWEHHFIEDNISWLLRCAAISIWSCSDNNHPAVLLVSSSSTTSQGHHPAFW